MGKKPVLTVLKNNAIDRHTKAELRARAEAEVGGASAELRPPRELSKAARAEWRRIVRIYRQLDHDVINDLDLALLAAYCENVALYRAAEKQYQEEPLVIDGKENPLIRIMDTAAKMIARAGEQLLLSPVGRARMGVLAAKKQKDADPMEQWLARKKG